MTDNEKLRSQFSIAAMATGAKTPQDISNALTELERADGLKIADYIAAFCRQRGIDPQAPELASYYRESTEYKAKIQADEDRRRKETALKALGEKSGAYQNNLGRNVPTTSPGMLELAGAIGKEAAILGSEQGELSRLGSFADYIRECTNYDPDRDFSPSLFDKLAFPDGTVSYIGARPSRGKTTVMVNLAREAITPEKPRKTIFISLEMSRKQILNKLILSTAYAMSTDVREKEFLKARSRPQTDLYHFIKGQNIDGEWEQAEAFKYCVKKATDHIQTAYNKSFLFYDGRGAKLPDIINMIKGNADPGTLVLLDYIQRMPSVPGKEKDDTYMRVKWISDEIVNAAILSNSVIISGAQFNRMGGVTDGQPDKFDDTSFRESGDLEQDAHNAIGIGWEADKKIRFFKLIKTREDAGSGNAFFIDFMAAYSYMAIGEKYKPKGSDGGSKGKKGNAGATDTSGTDKDVITYDMVKSQTKRDK